MLTEIPRRPRPNEQRQIGNFQAVSASPLCAWSAVNRIVCALSKLCRGRNLETACSNFEHVQTLCCGKLKRWVRRIRSVQFCVTVDVSSVAQKISNLPNREGLTEPGIEPGIQCVSCYVLLQLHQLTLCSVAAAPDATRSCEGHPEAENVVLPLLHDQDLGSHVTKSAEVRYCPILVPDHL